MRLLCLTRYGRLGASSRLRLFQYLPYLESRGFELEVAPLLSDAYVQGMYAGRIPWGTVVFGYWQRMLQLLGAGKYDAVWLEKECLPKLPAWFELGLLPRHVPLVVDYDDAVFHQYDLHPSALVRMLLGSKIDAVMRRADLVIAGNAYLADRARQAGARCVEILPTVVDTSRYACKPNMEGTTVTIGWIGSPATAHFLHLIAPALHEIARERNVRFVAVGANANQLNGLPVAALPWTEAEEVELIQQFDIGIMPLPDEPFERGKCGYKLIQCMACGKPVVASPVGANTEIVRDGGEGFWADSREQWVASLTRLIDDPVLRVRMGDAGRERAVNSYSLNVAAPRLEQLLRSMAG